MEEAARQAAARQAADDKNVFPGVIRSVTRRERRGVLVAGQGYAVCDLAEALDQIDQAEPRTGATEQGRRAGLPVRSSTLRAARRSCFARF